MDPGNKCRDDRFQGGTMFHSIGKTPRSRMRMKAPARRAARGVRGRKGDSEALPHSSTRRRRSELPITLTDDRAIAAAATMGDNSRPNTG